MGIAATIAAGRVAMLAALMPPGPPYLFKFFRVSD